MAVAKTYAKMEISGDPFMENKRMYVNVVTSKGLKKVRWYSDAEYRRMYPNEEVGKHDIMDFNARHVFGFGDAGYITIYRGDELALQECVENHHESFRRNLTFGYYTPSHIPVCTLPDGITPIMLKWEEVMDHDDRMKPHEEVTKYVQKLLGNDLGGDSTYQGAIDTWLERDIVILNNVTNTSHFGDKHIHTMADANGNIYVWETGAKNLATGTSAHLKMKVKEHKEINGAKTTVVYYCKII